jgi:hypothetical protein
MGGAQSPAHAMQAPDDPEQPVGFLAVFESRERAEAYAEGAPVAQVVATEAAGS